MKLNKAVWICTAWIIAALLFNIWIYFFYGHQKALEFFTGYVIELSLSVDNLFVFFLIFSHFKIDSAMQSRVLSWGVLGAQLMRAVFIFGAVALLKHLNWVMYVFGALLVFSGGKLILKKDKTVNLHENVFLILFKKIIPKNFTPFLMALIAVEVADLMFAMDSIPAVLAVTKDPFIVYSSNIFAILGLRAMYFVLSHFIEMFQYLHYALGIILIFVGSKMIFDHVWHMPTGYALGFIAVVLSVFAIISFCINKKHRRPI